MELLDESSDDLGVAGNGISKHTAWVIISVSARIISVNVSLCLL